jgi:hypothetical protein
MVKIEGSGSISQRHGSSDPDPDPHQNVMDPQHWNKASEFSTWVLESSTVLSKQPTSKSAKYKHGIK